MSYRLDDWECTICAEVHEEMTERGDDSHERYCSTCDAMTEHDRLFPLPAPYLGEKLEHAPGARVYGGKYDTEGKERGPRIPNLPGQVEHERLASAELAKLPMTATKADADAALARVAATAPSLADYRDHLHKPENQDILRERAQVSKRNLLKRVRGKLIDQGKTTVRACPIEGEAKEHHK
jgi:hypothetical protein